MKILYIEDNLACFLCALYHAYHKEKADMITTDSGSITLLDEVIEITVDLNISRKVRKGIIHKYGHIYEDIKDAFLSGDNTKSQKIYKYFDLLLKQGKKILTMYNSPIVIDFNDIIKKVRHEAHRLHGFLRFKEMDNGIFYSYFGSDNDVIELVLPHFIARYNSQQFVLHDIKRKKLAYFDGADIHFAVADNVSITLSDNEVLFGKLWKEYFDSVTINERLNPKLQRQFLPKKYQFFMNEF